MIRFTVLFALICSILGAQDYPPLPKPADNSTYGRGIERSMATLAAATADKPTTLRILFYGQSIMGSWWHHQVVEGLRQRYPHAIIEAENLALGGFSSQRLIHTMHYDVLPWYPDLFIFHVYGSDSHYEKLIKTIREQTSAEILIQTDHIAAKDWVAADDTPKPARWTRYMNEEFLPRIASDYVCGLQPQRREWIRYLQTHDLDAKALLSDNVHLNEHGKWLMANLLLDYMRERPVSQVDERIQHHQAQWKNGRIRIPFTGNRIVANCRPEGGSARVLIDGKPVSSFTGSWYHSRPSRCHGVPDWPVFKRATGTGLQTESWTITFSDFNEAEDNVAFGLTSSLTGADGSGRTNQDFVSTSGRVAISADSWVLPYSRKVGARSGKSATPEGFTATFESRLAGCDHIPAKAEGMVVLASMLPTGSHVLELLADDPDNPPLIDGLISYRP